MLAIYRVLLGVFCIVGELVWRDLYSISCQSHVWTRLSTQHSYFATTFPSKSIHAHMHHLVSNGVCASRACEDAYKRNSRKKVP